MLDFKESLNEVKILELVAWLSCPSQAAESGVSGLDIISRDNGLWKVRNNKTLSIYLVYRKGEELRVKHQNFTRKLRLNLVGHNLTGLSLR